MTQRTFFLVCLLGVSLCSARFNEGDDINRPMSAIDELKGNAALSERALLSTSPSPSPSPSPFPPLVSVESVTTIGNRSNESTTYTIHATLPVSGTSTFRSAFITKFISYLGNDGVLELTRSRRLLQTASDKYEVENFARTLLDAAITDFNATAGKISFKGASSGLATSIELYFSSKADESQNGLNTFNSEIQSSSAKTTLDSALAAVGMGKVLSLSAFSVGNGARLASMHAGVLALLAAVTAAVLMA